ncbi:MAG: alpha-L-arabinofuranosidase [Verrucomicrobiota bacterium]|nr:hypothetical protein [Limisphaera sp.]MDW8381508.1 alpha-L-arabinofuranosidase [Verrucomicrobiota bacterium]
MLLAQVSVAQAPLAIYTDRLVNGFEDWSWINRDLFQTGVVYQGSAAIRATGNAAQWPGLSFRREPFDARWYESLVFRAHGGATGGQRLQVTAEDGNGAGPAHVLPSALTAQQWREFIVPLSALGKAGSTNLHRINLQLRANGSSGTFYVDEVALLPRAAPTEVSLTVNAARVLRAVDPRWFGVNAVIWDNDFADNPTERNRTLGLLREMGMTTLRFPGGSLSDQYHWESNRTLTNTWQWNTSFEEFMSVATNLGAEIFITVNYGSGTPEEAAAWVRYANITRGYGIRYWEIGNECYGTWEYDTNARPHDAYTYAVRAAEYIRQMKAVDSSIKVGVVAVPGQDRFDNGYRDHPAVNPRTGTTHYGWTPRMLVTLRSLGVRPDFLIHHHYPQWSAENPVHSPVSDILALQSTDNWARDAADLRQQIRDFFGPEGDAIELVVTENNIDAGAQGRQSTSLVNALYYADSLGQLMRTEFNAFIWWDLRNGTDTTGSFDPTLYGWRSYGDLGMINGPATRHPVFYAAKLMSFFARPSDQVVEAVSSHPWLAVHAVRTTNGGLSVLVVNKEKELTLAGRLQLNDFLPAAAATVRFYGIPQDEAARTNAPLAAQDLSLFTIAVPGSSFVHSFPPLSLSLFTFDSAPLLAPRLNLHRRETGHSWVLTVQSSPGARVVLETSVDLISWVAIATNRPTDGFWVTEMVPMTDATARYWRATASP